MAGAIPTEADAWLNTYGFNIAPVRVDRGLAVLGRDDHERRLKQPATLQLAHHLADAGIDELDLIQHRGGRCPGGVGISTLDTSFNQLLSDAHRLKVHAEDGGDWRFVLAIVSHAIDLVQDGVDFQGIVALDVEETVGPGSYLLRVANRVARMAVGCGYSRQRNDIGIDLGGVIVVHIAGVV